MENYILFKLKKFELQQIEASHASYSEIVSFLLLTSIRDFVTYRICASAAKKRTF